MILGALLSLTVMAGTVVIICRLRSLLRYLDAKARLLTLARRPADPPAGGSKVTLISSFSRKFRPWRACTIAGSGLMGVLLTCSLSVIFFDNSARPTADHPATVRTVTTTITHRPSSTTITRTPEGDVTVIRQLAPPTQQEPPIPNTQPADNTGVLTATTTTVTVRRHRPPQTGHPSPSTAATPTPAVDTATTTQPTTPEPTAATAPQP